MRNGFPSPARAPVGAGASRLRSRSVRALGKVVEEFKAAPGVAEVVSPIGEPGVVGALDLDEAVSRTAKGSPRTNRVACATERDRDAPRPGRAHSGAPRRRVAPRRQGGRDPSLPQAGSVEELHRENHGRRSPDPLQLHGNPSAEGRCLEFLHETVSVP